MNLLKAKQVEALGAGRHADGGGLYLDKSHRAGGTGRGADATHIRSSWLFIWSRTGKRREMGLGAAGQGGLSLAEARDAAALAREQVKQGLDPIEARKAARAEPKRVLTFGEVADEFIASQSSGWRNAKHRAQWSMTLKVYAEPLRPIPVDQIDTGAVLEALKPIWQTKPETASRLRGRLEAVLDAAKAMGLRSGENPARWRGHLNHLLPKRQKLTRGHHAALPYAEAPQFVARLRKSEAVAARALEFLILTAARSGEVLGATWAEIDLDAQVWTVPAGRMKAGREHRVPLSPRAVELLKTMLPMMVTKNPASAPVFPSPRDGAAPLSAMGLAMLLRRMKVAVTAHGFRSTFRDWAGEVSPFPSDIAEAALAHVVGDATERAYRRGDALEKRRKLMEAWSGYIEPKAANVVALRKAAGG
jgi:integrase